MFNFPKNKEYQIIDNVFSEDIINKIENTLTGFYFPWYFYEETTHPESYFFKNSKNLKNCNDYCQFVHSLYVPSDNNFGSEYFNLVLSLLNQFSLKHKIDFLKIERAKANLQTQYQDNNEKNFNIPHKDLDTEHYVFLYYVNDSDGDTIIFDDNNKIIDKIKPKRGRVLLFDGNLLHSSSHPILSKKRIVINIDLKKYVD